MPPGLPDHTAPARRPNKYAGFRDRRCSEACTARESRLSGRLPAAVSRVQGGIENSDSDLAASARAARRPVAPVAPSAPVAPFALSAPSAPFVMEALVAPGRY